MRMTGRSLPKKSVIFLIAFSSILCLLAFPVAAQEEDPKIGHLEPSGDSAVIPIDDVVLGPRAGHDVNPTANFFAGGGISAASSQHATHPVEVLTGNEVAAIAAAFQELAADVSQGSGTVASFRKLARSSLVVKAQSFQPSHASGPSAVELVHDNRRRVNESQDPEDEDTVVEEPTDTEIVFGYPTPSSGASPLRTRLPNILILSELGEGGEGPFHADLNSLTRPPEGTGHLLTEPGAHFEMTWEITEAMVKAAQTLQLSRNGAKDWHPWFRWIATNFINDNLSPDLMSQVRRMNERIKEINKRVEEAKKRHKTVISTIDEMRMEFFLEMPHLSAVKPGTYKLEIVS